MDIPIYTILKHQTEKNIFTKICKYLYSQTIEYSNIINYVNVDYNSNIFLDEKECYIKTIKNSCKLIKKNKEKSLYNIDNCDKIYHKLFNNNKLHDKLNTNKNNEVVTNYFNSSTHNKNLCIHMLKSFSHFHIILKTFGYIGIYSIINENSDIVKLFNIMRSFEDFKTIYGFTLNDNDAKIFRKYLINKKEKYISEIGFKENTKKS